MATRKKDGALNEAAEREASPAPDLPDLNVSSVREDPSIDPELEAIRDRESAELAKVEVQSRPDPVLDPELAELRDKEAAAQADRLDK